MTTQELSNAQYEQTFIPTRFLDFVVTQRACEGDSPATTHVNLCPGSTGEPESETPCLSSRLP